MRNHQHYRAGRKNILVAGIVNLGLFALKLAAGIQGHSQAMVTDAFHTLSDLFSSGVAWLGLKLGGRPGDTTHPYGHGKFETMATVLLAVILGGAGFSFLLTSLARMMRFQAATPTILPLLAAAFSIILKETLYQYTIRVSRRIDSTALRADAWHHRSDMLSSATAFLGILAARLGFPLMDPLAAAIIAIFILKVSLKIGQDAFNELVESSLDKKTIAKLRARVLSVDGVLRVHDLAGRRLGPEIVVEMHILVNPNLSVLEGHRLADTVEHTLKREYPNLSRATVHVDPMGRET